MSKNSVIPSGIHYRKMPLEFTCTLRGFIIQQPYYRCAEAIIERQILYSISIICFLMCSFYTFLVIAQVMSR
jgi:hypothetical protein